MGADEASWSGSSVNTHETCFTSNFTMWNFGSVKHNSNVLIDCHNHLGVNLFFYLNGY
jgi:hypothetical protein